jgi:hypothetical protein
MAGMEREYDCQKSVELVPLKRFTIWTYGNDWDGWGFHSTTDDKAEAEETLRVLGALPPRLFSGVVMAETVGQICRPGDWRSEFELELAARWEKT